MTTAAPHWSAHRSDLDRCERPGNGPGPTRRRSEGRSKRLEGAAPGARSSAYGVGAITDASHFGLRTDAIVELLAESFEIFTTSPVRGAWTYLTPPMHVTPLGEIRKPCRYPTTSDRTLSVRRWRYLSCRLQLCRWWIDCYLKGRSDLGLW